MKRKIISGAAAAIMLFSLLPHFDAYSIEAPDISAKAAVLISADTGEIVYSHDHDQKLSMASTTKIMSALLCLESGELYEEFVVDSEAIKVEGSSMGLQEGDIVTKYALCCGMLLPSGNDAANAAAVKIAGSIEGFVKMMNERAEEIGLTRTFFVTPSGLEGEGHGSSAFDMALLAREALKNELFREICSSQTISLSYGNPPYKRWLTNTNKLLSMCEGVYGVKTGFTDEAGRCLVSACERDGENLICVTLNDKNDWNDHIALYDYGFQTVQLYEPKLPQFIEMDVVGSDSERVSLKCGDEPVKLTTADVNAEAFSYSIISAPFAYAPIAQGEQLAELCIMYGDREVCRIPFYADSDCGIIQAEPAEKNILEKIIDKLRGVFS